jgi:hypothetical protein
MLTNTDSKLSPPSSVAAGDQALHRPLDLLKSANGPLIIGLAAALALKFLDGIDTCDRAEVRIKKAIEHATHAYFGALGVTFDASGRPKIEAAAVDIASVDRLHGEASKLAYFAIATAVYEGPGGEDAVTEFGSEIAAEAGHVAFRDGAPIDISVGSSKLKRAVHALDSKTGQCLGDLGLFC